MFSNFLVALLPVIVSASPSGLLSGQALDTGTHCGQYDIITAGRYSLLLNQWGKLPETAGKACAAISSLDDNTISWSTSWTWSGDPDIESYTNIQLNEGINKQLSSIKSIRSSWKWSQHVASGRLVSNVAYDFFTSASAGGKTINEVMIWIAADNLRPLSDLPNRAPARTGVSIEGFPWDLYIGVNGVNGYKVYSFVLCNNARATDFSANLNAFIKYLTQLPNDVPMGPIDPNHYLTTAQAGTEAFAGTATLITTAYDMSIE